MNSCFFFVGRNFGGTGRNWKHYALETWRPVCHRRKTNTEDLNILGKNVERLAVSLWVKRYL